MNYWNSGNTPGYGDAITGGEREANETDKTDFDDYAEMDAEDFQEERHLPDSGDAMEQPVSSGAQKTRVSIRCRPYKYTSAKEPPMPIVGGRLFTVENYDERR